jgi:putative ABC transport system permease protein
VGFKMESILAGLLVLPTAKYPNPDARASFYDRLDARLQAIPGVESTAIADFLPLPGQRLPSASYELDGVPVTERDQRSQTASRVVVSPAFFRTLGTTLLSGRAFSAADAASSVPVAIVNQQFVNKHWPSENPLGKRLRLFRGQTPQAWLTVVGVAPNLVQNGAGRQAFDPTVYIPYRQTGLVGMWVIARTGVAPGGLAMAVRREVQALDAELPLSSGPAPLSARLVPIYQYRGLTAGLFFVFAALALLLASIGLYAVIAHSVSQRMQEIGIRTAMGATAGDILALVFKQGMLPAGIGLAFGLVGSLGVVPILGSQLVQVSAADPMTLAVASATLILSSALGCVLPARRAMQVDPVVALRHE